MDIYDRVNDLLDRVCNLENKVSELQRELNLWTGKPTSPQEVTQITKRVPRDVKKTQYFPAVTEELANISKYDLRSEDTVVAKRSANTTDPRLRAAINAVSRVVELSKDADILVEEINHLAKVIMDKHEIQPKGTFSDPEKDPISEE